MSEPKPRVLSGVQPTGNLHLGNYLGAIRNFVELQNSHECLYCVVDLHAITVFQDPAELAANTREVAAAFIAAGVDPKNHIVFNQAQVPHHAELAWVLNCVARMGWLNRMTQFKEKAGKDREKARSGFTSIPILWPPIFCSIKQPMCRSAKTKNNISNWPVILRKSSIMILTLKDFSAARAAHSRAGDTGDEPARRQ